VTLHSYLRSPSIGRLFSSDKVSACSLYLSMPPLPGIRRGSSGSTRASVVRRSIFFWKSPRPSAPDSWVGTAPRPIFDPPGSIGRGFVFVRPRLPCVRSPAYPTAGSLRFLGGARPAPEAGDLPQTHFRPRRIEWEGSRVCPTLPSLCVFVPEE
jgi:hypothetical protein